MTSPWASGADSNSIWNSNSPNLNLLRRYSLRSSNNISSTPLTTVSLNNSSSIGINNTKSTCSWEPSADRFQLSGGRPTHDGHLGAIVEHVVPGSLMNIICKLRVGDEIVEWNGFDLRNKRNEEVLDIIDSVKNANSLRLVAIRQVAVTSSNNNNSNNGSASTSTSGVSLLAGNCSSNVSAGVCNTNMSNTCNHNNNSLINGTNNTNTSLTNNQ